MKKFFDSTVDFCNIIPIKKRNEQYLNATTVCNNCDIPFALERVYYLYDVPTGEYRGGHAHKKLSEILIAACGSFDVIIDDGRKDLKITLNRPDEGLLLYPGIWRELINFSSGAICLVLASDKYYEEDYIRKYPAFLKEKING